MKAWLNVTIPATHYTVSGMKEYLTVLESLQESRLILSSVVLPCSQQVSCVRHAETCTIFCTIAFFFLIRCNVKINIFHDSHVSFLCTLKVQQIALMQPHTVSSDSMTALTCPHGTHKYEE